MSTQRSFQCCGITNLGHYRKVNEDHFLISEVATSIRIVQTSMPLDHQARLFGDTKGLLLLVADGMGGHAGGERASQLVIEGVVEYVLNQLSGALNAKANSKFENELDFEAELKLALRGCQQRIAQDVLDNPQRRGMGSTLTLAYIVWPKAYILHVGDSRCYLLRAGELRQMTRDHNLASLMQEPNGIHYSTGAVGEMTWIDEDEDDEEETVEDKTMSHVLWNVVAADASNLHPDAFCLELKEDDLLLLCTDGLYQDLSRKRLKNLLENPGSVAEICDLLVREALIRGGSDNITAVLTRCGSKREHSVPQTIEMALPQVELWAACQGSLPKPF
jgi:PPM family protein phosphatase